MVFVLLVNVAFQQLVPECHPLPASEWTRRQIGTTRFWGNSPALNLLGDVQAGAPGNDHPSFRGRCSVLTRRSAFFQVSDAVLFRRVC